MKFHSAEMFKQASLIIFPLLLSGAFASAETTILNMTAPPKAGQVELYPENELRPGMKGVAWTVFQGTKPEPIPVEIVGIWENGCGPRQDIIIGKLTGKASRTNVAGGMSGSPVYIDGKLVGAISLRLSVFSPDAICGITPIRLMLDVKAFDQSRPSDARSPEKIASATASDLRLPEGLLKQVVSASTAVSEAPSMTPISTPINFSGFSEETVRQFAPIFNQLGLTVAQGGAGGKLNSSKPAPDWPTALQPGDSVAAVLVSGDMN